MNVIVILLLASLSVAMAFLAAFVWAVRSGQYEDTMTPSLRILADDEGPRRGVISGKDTVDKGTEPA